MYDEVCINKIVMDVMFVLYCFFGDKVMVFNCLQMDVVKVSYEVSQVEYYVLSVFIIGLLLGGILVGGLLIWVLCCLIMLLLMCVIEQVEYIMQGDFMYIIYVDCVDEIGCLLQVF